VRPSFFRVSVSSPVHVNLSVEAASHQSSAKLSAMGPCASIVVVAEGAEMVVEVVAEELTVGGQLKGTIPANRVRLNGTGVVGGIFSIAHWRSKRMLTPAAN
jgi:hypothetical protein